MRVAILLVAAILAAPPARAQAQAADAGEGSACLALPFENRSGNASLDWIGSSFVVSLRAALADDGVQVLDRVQQQRALSMVGAPPGAPVSLATQMRMADTADVAWLVSGWFDYDGTTLDIHAGLLNMKREHWVPMAQVSGPLDQLETLENRLDWALTQRMVPGATAEPEPSVSLPLSAYESYVRADLAASPADKIRFLLAAQHLAPSDPRILYALGMAYFHLKHDDSALHWLSQVPSPESRFTAALAAYHLGEYSQSISLLQALADEMPLPAVVHDLALAQTAERQHKPAAGQLETEFPADAFRQLSNTVGQFNAARTQALPPAQQADHDLARAAAMQKQGALESALQLYQGVVASTTASAHQRAEAHAGLAEIAWSRHDVAQAEKEVAAAEAAEPDNARAQAMAAQMAAAGRR